MDIERDELECFLTLADTLHFGRTAERMRLSKSRITQLVQRLERRIGAPLFTRTSRRVELTALGARLREELAPHHRAIREALARASAAARGIEGVLHVGFAGPPAGEIVTRAAEAVRREHPGLEVRVCEVPLAEPVGALRRGDYDLQLTADPLREPDTAAGPELLRERRLLALPAAHPLASSGPDGLSLDDLAGLSLLPVDGRLPDYLAEHHAPAATPSGRAVGRGPSITNLQEGLTLVAAGQGALLTGAHAAEYFPRRDVAYRPLRGAEPLSYRLHWRTASAECPPLRALVAAAERVAGERGAADRTAVAGASGSAGSAGQSGSAGPSAPAIRRAEGRVAATVAAG